MLNKAESQREYRTVVVNDLDPGTKNLDLDFSSTALGLWEKHVISLSLSVFFCLFVCLFVFCKRQINVAATAAITTTIMLLANILLMIALSRVIF